MNKWKRVVRKKIKRMIEKGVWPPVCWGIHYEAEKPDKNTKG